MMTFLNILFVEDSPDDAQLILLQLEQDGLQAKYRRAETEADFRAALDSPPDLILSDFALPHFNGLRALRIVRERGLDIPFILISGTIGEDLAVDAIKQGADDYLMKDRLGRLAASIQNALNQKRLRGEKARADLALRKSEMRLRSIFQAVPVSIWEEDFTAVHAALEELRAQGVTDFRAYIKDHPEFSKHALQMVTVLDVNETTLRLYGAKDKAELLGYLEQFLSAEEFGEELITFAEGRTYFEKETTNLTAHGQVLNLWMTQTFFADEDGHYKSLVCLSDITERKRAEAALYESETRFRSLIENSSDEISIIAADGSLLYESPSANPTLGYQPGEFLGKSLFQLVHPDDLERLQREFEQLLRDPEQHPRQRFRLLHHDGTWRWVEAVGTNLLNEPSVRGVVVNYHDVTEQVQAEAATLRHLSELEALYENGLAINRLLNPHEIGERIIETFARYLSWHHVTIRLRKEQNDELELIAFNLSGFHGEEKASAEMKFNAISRVGQGLSGYVVQTGKPFRTGRLPEHQQFLKIYEDMQSGLYMPLKVGNRVIGVISVESEEADAFSEADERLLATLANQAAVAFENARLYQSVQQELSERKRVEEQVQKQLQRLEALHRIDMAIASGLEINVSLGLLLDQALAILNVDAADVLLLEASTRLLRYGAGRGFRSTAIQNTHLAVGKGFAGRAALERRTIHIHDLNDNLDKFSRSTSLADEAFKSYFAVPLIVKGQIKGVLEIFHRSPLDPAEDWINFLETMASQAAIIIEDAQLFDKLQRSNMELAMAYDATIEGWSRALDLRDKETEGHTQRVTSMTLELAQAINIDPKDLVHIRRGALLHDIGKMGVPDAILLKPAELTGEEWEIMKRHPQYAYEMLTPIAYLRPSLDIPYCHHEKWDGSGYPRGLKGEEIPLAARIFAIADVWDALTSDRPYRKAWSNQRALEFIREQSGQHFDPHLVDAFLSLNDGRSFSLIP